ncbi:MAG: ABC transporter substrate-binding protein [Nocardioides sp.]|uniref:ABC transporter substrate-binding protein n=1 Tax=Nocardioides sp. TaxID=35761 RepID=UPI0039E29192
MRSPVRVAGPARSLLAVLLAVALLLLGACGSDGDDGADGADNTWSDGATRTVTTDMGRVTIPTDPQRVVVLNQALAGYLYHLDIPVAGTLPTAADTDDTSYESYWADDAEEDGTVVLPWSSDGFDLEAILKLKPDLIVAGGVGFPLAQATKAYDKLTDIAPTVIVSGKLDTWQKQFAYLAEDVFEKPAVYQELLADYRDRIKEVKAAITPPPGPVSYLTVTADGTAYGLIESLGLPKELKKVGLEPAPLYASGHFKAYVSGGDAFPLSTEQVGQYITQKSVFIMGFNADTTDVKTLSKNPVYAALPAFKSGHAYDLPWWGLRGDYDESMALLTKVEKLFG